MGGTASSPSDDDSQMSREIRMLLGNLDGLDPIAQRIVGLGKKCLTSTVMDSQHSNFKRLEKFTATTQGDSHHSAEGGNQFDPVEFANSDYDISSSLPKEDTSSPQACAQIVPEQTGVGQDASSVSPMCQQDEELFRPLQQARPIYLGQTYPRWKTLYNVQNFYAMCVPTRSIVYIQPIDDFPDFVRDFRISIKSMSLDLFSLLQGFTQIFFSGLDVTVMPNLSMERSGWRDLVKSRHHSVTCEKQYRAKDFYPLLQQMLPGDGHCILGLVWTDLYPEDDLNFTLGETSFNHRAGIFCFGRFETKGFNRETHKDISRVDAFLIWKLIRCISHEMCHLFGLRHCTYFHCSMNESTSLVEAMDQPLFLCPVCLRKLHQVCKFDVLDRYHQLLSFLSELQSNLPYVHFERSVSWLKNCISYLEQPITP